MDSSLCNCNFNCSSSQFLYFRSPHRIPSRYLIPLPIFISSSFTSIAAIYITNFSFRKLNCRFLCRVKASTLQQKDKKVSVKESLSTKKGLNKDGLTDSGPITRPGFVEKNAIKVEQSINTFLTVRSTYMFLLFFILFYSFSCITMILIHTSIKPVTVFWILSNCSIVIWFFIFWLLIAILFS